MAAGDTDLLWEIADIAKGARMRQKARKALTL
jgi:hypothetical protein